MHAHENFAVMLNANARKVTPNVRRKIEGFVPPENIFYSRSMDESIDIANEIASRQYPTVFTGGGDGTFVKFVNDYCESRSPVQMARSEALPDMGVLHLGTGNAVASIVSSGNYECDLQSYLASGYRNTQQLQLVEADGMRFPFGGLGWDAEILNDYNMVKRSLGMNRFLRPVVRNVGGYFAAFFGKTMPRHFSQMFNRVRTEVRITNLGNDAAVLYGGEPVKWYGPGEVLYEGPSNITLFGTLPYYGYNMTVLPYAMERPGYFHLRVVRMSMLKILANLRSIWKGTKISSDLLDWHASHVRLEFNHTVPYQFGGDAAGYRESIELKTSPVEVSLLRFI